MLEVQEHVRAAIESLESLRDTRVSEIVKKLKSAENDIENLMKSETSQSLKEVRVIGVWGSYTVVGTTDPYYKKYTPWEHRVPDTVTPDSRDQWGYTGKIPEGS